jgi:hypothetical protein
MTALRVDFALYNQSGRLAAVIEVKNKMGTSREWASKLRRNMFAHGEGYNADFFLLVMPDRLYLWKNAAATPLLAPPTYEIDARSLFAPYFEKAGVNADDISGYAFELVVAAWLGDLVRSEEQTEKLTNEQRWLVESGFLAAVRDGRVAYEEAA